MNGESEAQSSAETDWEMLDCVIRLAVETGDAEALSIAANRLAGTAGTPGPSTVTGSMEPADRICARVRWALAQTRYGNVRRQRERALINDAHSIWRRQ